MSPLTGFMDEKDYRSVIEDMRLASGLPWSIPITLNVAEDDVKRIGRSGPRSRCSLGRPRWRSWT